MFSTIKYEPRSGPSPGEVEEIGISVIDVMVDKDVADIVVSGAVIDVVVKVDALVVCVEIVVTTVVVVVTEDLGNPIQSAIIVLKQIHVNKMPIPIAILGYLLVTLFKHVG